MVGLFGPRVGNSSGVLPGNSSGCGGGPGSRTGGGTSGRGFPGGLSGGGSVGCPGVAGGISGGSIGIASPKGCSSRSDNGERGSKFPATAEVKPVFPLRSAQRPGAGTRSTLHGVVFDILCADTAASGKQEIQPRASSVLLRVLPFSA